MVIRSRSFAFLRRGIACAVLLLTVSFARAAEPEVLSQVPGDAYAVVVVNNVRTAGTKVSNVLQRLNVMFPPDVVGFATRSMGITRGFDANSSAAMILLKPSAERIAEGYFNSPPPAVLLLPTSDPKGMLEAFTPSDPDKDGISEVTLITEPGKGYVATIAGKWIAFATSKEFLQSYLARTDTLNKTLPAESLKVFESNDLVMWANVAKLAVGLDKELEVAQSQAIDQLDFQRLATNQDPFTTATQRQIVIIAFSFVKQYLKDADSAMLTARLTDSGISIGMVGAFKPDSDFSRFIAAQKTARPASLQGLPDGNFLLAGAMSWDSKSVGEIVDRVVKQVLSDENLAKSPNIAELKKSFETVGQVMALVQGQSLILLDPPAGGKNGFFHGAVLYDTTDPAKLLDFQLQILKSGLAGTAMNPDLKQSVDVSPDAVTLKGVKLTKVVVKFTLRDETPEKPISIENRMAAQLLQTMYGPEGLTAYLGIAGKHVLAIYGSEAATLESAIDAALADSDALAKNPSIVATKDQVVPNPLAVVYLPVTRWATLFMSLAMPAAPGEAPRPPIANAPPVVISAGVAGNTITGEFHVPIATIISLRDAYMRLENPQPATGVGGGGIGGKP